MESTLNQGSIFKTLLKFAIPFLISSFLQTFYGLTDLFVIGLYNGAASTSAVSIGSQVTHMLTVVIVGLAMGTTVSIASAIGAGDHKKVSCAVGNTLIIFTAFTALLMAALLIFINPLIAALSTPAEAVSEAYRYLFICFLGIPFIVAYNVIAGIFRGYGDSRTPMYFVAAAGVINIGLDFLLIGPLKMAAAGAALATIASQAVSVMLALAVLLHKKKNTMKISRRDLHPDKKMIRQIIAIGSPIAFQDLLIQISFLVITAIVNRQGVVASASVGIVEKLISFLFLINSSMLSAISAIVAQNVGSGLHERGKKTLRYGIGATTVFALIVAVIVQLAAPAFIRAFTSDTEVIAMGAVYFKAYVWDCLFAGFHFCFSGYFCAYQKSLWPFIYNLAAIGAIRIPGAVFMTSHYPGNLYPLGWVAPCGSLLSTLLCLVFYHYMCRKKINAG